MPSFRNQTMEKEIIYKKDYISYYDPKKIEQAFKIALETRKFEIELYWKRTAYFVLFIGAVFVAYYSILSSKGIPNLFLLFLSFWGYLLSLLWYTADKGSKYWQENWEHHIEELSMHLKIPIFGIIKYRKSQNQIMGSYPYSVSKVNQMVSIIIGVGWILMFFKDIINLAQSFDSTCPAVIVMCGIIIGVGFILVSYCVVHYKCKGFAAEQPANDNKDYFYNYHKSL